VHNFLVDVQIFEYTAEVYKNFPDLRFLERLSFFLLYFDQLRQIKTFDKLHHNAETFLFYKWLIVGHDIRMLKRFIYFDLFEVLLKVFVCH
jgi:hypothetical protein